MKKGLVFFLLGAVLVSCGFQEDPLADKDQSLINLRQLPGSENRKPSIESSVLKIDVDPSVDFYENKKGVILINFNVVDPAYDNKFKTLRIKNMADFPGASFDPTKGSFEWTPAPGSAGDTLVKSLSLEIEAWARTLGREDSQSTSTTVGIHIIKDPQAPAVSGFSVNGLDPLREGDIKEFEVRVKDIEGTDKFSPVVTFLPALDNEADVSVSSFITTKSVTPDLKIKEWVYKFTVDLRRVDLTAAAVRAGFRMVVSNQYGKSSPVHVWTGTLFTKLSSPVITWTGNKFLNQNQDNVIPFMVFDPKGEGRLTYRVTSVPAGGNVSCVPATGSMECEFRYKPLTTNSGTISLEVTSKNTDINDTQVVTTPFTMPYSVLAAPTPAPTPTPTPTPTTTPDPTPSPSPTTTSIPIKTGVN
jgi:hypothetical protein